MKNRMVILCCLMMLVLCISSLANAAEAPAITYTMKEGYAAGGLITLDYFNKGYVCYYDYASGAKFPLCTKPNCTHDIIVYGGAGDENWSPPTLGEAMADTSECYAQRLRYDNFSYLFYGGKVYFVECMPWPYDESFTFNLYESEIDGPTRKIASLGERFNWEQTVDIGNMIAYDGTLYLVIQQSENTLIEGDETIDAEAAKERKRSAALPQQAMIWAISMKDGSVRELCRMTAQDCAMSMLGLVDGVLYYEYVYANDFTPAQPSDWDEAWYREFESKARYGIRGVNMQTGETVALHERLEDVLIQDAVVTARSRGNEMYVWISPRYDDSKPSHYMRFDLLTGTCLYEYDYQAPQEGYAGITLRLTDTLMLTTDWYGERFGLLDLQSGAFTSLAINGEWEIEDFYQGPSIIVQYDSTRVYQAGVFTPSGPIANRDYYQTPTCMAQGEYVVFDHCFEDGRRVKAYTTIDDLIAGNVKLTDFVEE